MSWNSDQNGKDPWGRDKGSQQGPPDLDALLRQYKNKLVALMGGKGGSHVGRGGSAQGKAAGFFGLLILLGILVVWALSGIFIVAPAERAVILRFGQYVETVQSGPHWIPRFIETKQIVNVQQVSTYTYQADMLTKDENIVSVQVTVLYRAQDARNFLFNVVDPVASLEQATASAMRQAVGHNTLDDLLTVGKAKVREQVYSQLQSILNTYASGIVVTDVTLQAISPPEEVTAAFDDVIKAKEDEMAYVNQANAYANQVLAQAQGQANRTILEAKAYQQQVVLDAQGSITSYLALLPEYHKSPDVTKNRLYLSAMETIFSNNSKVFIDQKQGNPILYLPLDKMLTQSATQPSANAAVTSAYAESYKNSMNAGTGGNRISYPSRGNSQ